LLRTLGRLAASSAISRIFHIASDASDCKIAVAGRVMLSDNRIAAKPGQYAPCWGTLSMRFAGDSKPAFAKTLRSGKIA